MSKVTRDGIIRTLASDADSDGTSVGGETSATPPPRKRLDLNATITLSEEALAELLAEVKSGRATSEPEDEAPRIDAAALPPAALPRPPERLPERAPAHPAVPHLWRRFEGGSSKRKV